MTLESLTERFSDVTLATASYDWLNIFASGTSQEVTYQTTGDAFETAITATVADQETLEGRLEVIAKENVGYGRCKFVISYLIVGNLANPVLDWDTMSKDCVLADGMHVVLEVSGSNVLVKVQGIAGRTFDWTIKQDQGGNI